MKLNPTLSTACWLALLCAPQMVLAEIYSGISGSIGGIYQSDPRLMAELLETVKNRRCRSRADAIRVLECRGALPPAAAPVFISGLKDRDLEMRAASADLLGNVRPTTDEVSASLSGALRDKHEVVRLHAARSILKIDPTNEAAVQALIDALTSKNSGHSNTALYSLWLIPALQDRAITALTAAIKSESLQARAAATRVLADQFPASNKFHAALKLAIHDHDPVVRFTAASGLARYGRADSEVAAILIDFLRNEDGKLRTAAATALGDNRLPSAPVVQSLIAALYDPAEQVRLAAIESLGEKLAAKDAVPALTEILRDESLNVRDAAAAALAMFHDTPREAIPALMVAILDPLSNHFNTGATKALAEVNDVDGSTIVWAKLIQALHDKNPVIRRRAIRTVAELKYHDTTAVGPVIAVLSDPDPQIRAAAARAIGRIEPGTRRSVDALLKAASDTTAYVRATAIETLGRSGLHSTVAHAAFVHALRDNDGQVQNAGAAALGTHGLLELLKNADPSVRSAAVRGLVTVRGTDAMPELIDALRDEEPGVRSAAASAIGNICSYWPKRGLESKTIAAELQREHGADPAIPRLIELTKDKDSQVRATSIAALRNLGPHAESALPEISEALVDQNAEVRCAAARAIAEIDIPFNKFTPWELNKALQDSDPSVRHWAAIACERIGASDSAVDPLVMLLNDPKAEIRAASAEALVKISEKNITKVIAPLMNALRDENQSVRDAAQRSLGRLGWTSKDVVVQLTKLLRDANDDLRCTALAALAEVGINARCALPDIIVALADGEENRIRPLQEAAVSAIANVDPEPKQLISELIQRFSSYENDYPAILSDVLKNIGEAGVAELIPVLGDKNHGRRRFAVWALGALGPTAQSAAPQLVALLNDPDSDIQTTALEALVQIGPSAKNDVRRLLTDADESTREVAQEVLDRIGDESPPDLPMP